MKLLSLCALQAMLSPLHTRLYPGGLTIDSHEARELQSLPRRLHTGDPILHTLIVFLSLGTFPLRDDLATLIAHEKAFGQAPYGLLLASPKDNGFGKAAMRNLADPLGCRLHGGWLRCLECHADACKSRERRSQDEVRSV